MTRSDSLKESQYNDSSVDSVNSKCCLDQTLRAYHWLGPTPWPPAHAQIKISYDPIKNLKCN